ncbi:MAG TPA: MFS transporter [Acidimicrobiales bacterium]|jgi:MFS family permease|nr:MFS transporter [Acidimicrobiales bacterium]
MGAREWLGALSERNFRLFFIGQAASQIGSGMAPVAITFAVLVHGTPTDVGLVASAGLIPVVVLLPLGGVVSDRTSRRVVMLSADVLRTAAEIGLGVWILLATPPLWAFLVLAACVGTGLAFFTPALTGIVPEVVSAGRLQQANALYGLSGSVAGIVGPILAGVIVAVSSPGWAVFIDGLTYAVSVVTLVLIRIDWVARPATASILGQLREGWQEFWARSWLWVIVVEWSLCNLLVFAPYFVLGPVIAKQSLGGALAWGVVLTCEGAGAVLGGVLLLRWRPTRPLLVATLVSFAWAWPLFALAYVAPLAVLSAGAFTAGVGVAIFTTLWNTTVQREIPTELLSRVSAYDWFGSLVFLSVGLALIGPVAKAIGLRVTIAGAAVLMIALVGATLCVPSVRGMRAPPIGERPEPATRGGLGLGD